MKQMKYTWMVFILWLGVWASFAHAKDAKDDVQIEADTLVRDEQGVVTAAGDVVITRKDETLRADQVVYSADGKQMQATGHVHIQREGSDILAQSANMADDETGELTQVQAELRGGQYLEADVVLQRGSYVFDANNVYVTNCPKEDAPWKLHASSAQVNQDEGVLRAQDMRFEFLDVPLLYTPYWQQALQRGSGLLMPSFTTSRYRGTEWAVPYYWAPRADWDVTLTPHWSTALGAKGDVEVRHASAYGRERIQLEGLHDARMGRSRYRIAGELQEQYADVSLQVQGDHVSDGFYFTDMGTDSRQATAAYASTTASLSGTAPATQWMLYGLHQQQLRVASNAASLQILPRLQATTRYDSEQGLGTFRVAQQWTRFSRAQGFDGVRGVIQPSVSKQWELMPGIQNTVHVESMHTRYWMQQYAGGSRFHSNAVAGSLETRVALERVAQDKDWRHAFTPVLRWDSSYVPAQQALPVFDSGLAALNINNVLHGNRYVGLDRMERMQRVSLMLDNSVQHKSTPKDVAREVLRFRIGATYDVYRTGTNKPLSSIVADTNIRPVEGLNIAAGAQYEPYAKYMASTYASSSYAHDDGHGLYVYWTQANSATTTTQEQVQSSMTLKLASRWKLEGAWHYDLLRRFTQQGSVGVAYEHPCWDVQLQGFRQNVVGSTGLSDVGVRFMIGFKGLGSIGS